MGTTGTADAFTQENAAHLGQMASSMQTDIGMYIWAAMGPVGHIIMFVVGISFCIAIFRFVAHKL